MSDKAVHALVTGQVQQVGFRQSCRQIARSLGLVGWVRNTPEGQVEVFAQGGGEEVDRLVAWLWGGPATAVVTGVQSDVVAPDITLRDFFIHPNPMKGD
ncbi:MAG TPA: acylphosphatase [Acidimicrobiia bacterium]|nr:acylphosphatase [Acidimicrobiia bacterium]